MSEDDAFMDAADEVARQLILADSEIAELKAEIQRLRDEVESLRAAVSMLQKVVAEFGGDEWYGDCELEDRCRFCDHYSPNHEPGCLWVAAAEVEETP